MYQAYYRENAMKIRRRSPLTIIEIMIVITIISIVGGLMTHNMKGSLAKGRSFKSEAASKEAHDILSLQQACGTNIEDIIKNPSKIIIDSGLVKSTKKLLQDGWGKPFDIRKVGEDDFILYSKRWVDYLEDKKGMNKEEIEENYPWAYNSSVIEEYEG
jgi:type II secretory pathway pseudopilin PulG